MEGRAPLPSSICPSSILTGCFEPVCIHLHPKRFKPAGEIAEVLFGENFRPGHQRDVEAAFQTINAVQAATAVLPEPTSPCSKRRIGWSAAHVGADLAVTRVCGW